MNFAFYLNWLVLYQNSKGTMNGMGGLGDVDTLKFLFKSEY